MAKELNVKSLLISGSLGEGYQQLYNYFVSCHSITRGPISLDNCIEIADELLYESSRNIARLLNCLIS
jgi:glycerate kinase